MISMAQQQLFETEVKPPTKALNISLYDVSGAPLHPNYVLDLIAKAKEVASREPGLAITVIED